MANQEPDALHQLLDLLNDCNDFPSPKWYTGSGLNRGASGKASSTIADTMMRHSRNDLQLSCVCYHPDLLNRIMETSKPRVQTLLNLDPDAFTQCSEALKSFLKNRNLASVPPTVSSEASVGSYWARHFGDSALDFLNYLFANIGAWHNDPNPIYLPEGDLPPDFVPIPDYNFSLYPRSAIQLSSTTASIASSKSRSGPSKSHVTRKTDFGEPSSNDAVPEVHVPNEFQLLTVKVKAPFHDPSLLSSLDELLRDKQSFKFEFPPQPETDPEDKMVGVLAEFDSSWGDCRQRDHPTIHTTLNLPPYSVDGHCTLNDKHKYRHISLVIHQVWNQMLCANTTFAMLTDYVTTYIMVRSRQTGTLYISSAIKHDATNPSLVCVIFNLLALAYYEFQERTLPPHEILTFGTNPPMSSQQGEGPAVTLEGSHSLIEQAGGHNQRRQRDDEADANLRGSPSKCTRFNDDRKIKMCHQTTSSSLNLLPSFQAWTSDCVHFAPCIEWSASAGSEKVENLGSMIASSRPALPESPIVKMIFRTRGLLNSTYPSILRMRKNKNTGSISSSGDPRLVLVVRGYSESTIGGVWRGYLDYPDQGLPFAVVAKFGKLSTDSLLHEAAIYARIKECGGLAGVPSLIGLYKIEDVSTWGVMIQSDCGVSLTEGQTVTNEERETYRRIVQRLHRICIIHGDLRPQNLVRSHDGSLAVIGFQFSSVLEGDELERKGSEEMSFLEYVLDNL